MCECPLTIGSRTLAYKRPFLDILAEPLVRVFARSCFMPFNRLLLDLAYRLNGFGTWYPDKAGLPTGETKAMARLLQRIEPHVVFDVGANRGDFAKHVRSLCPDAEVRCFEPQPRAFAALEEIATDYSLIAENVALSKAKGSMTLYDQKGAGFSTTASLNKAAVEAFSSDIEAFEVDVTSVDTYCQKHGLTKIDLLKIDTEGYDLNVLKGATTMLSAGNISAVSFEFIPANLKTHVFFYEILDELKGFDVFRILPGGSLYKIEDYTYRYCEIFVPSSYIALKKTQS